VDEIKGSLSLFALQHFFQNLFGCEKLEFVYFYLIKIVKCFV
jgi:hypothetical protein